MALTYADLSGGVLAKSALYASKMNALRTAISRRATVSGASVTLPDSVTAKDPFAAQFEDWLKAARTAIEAIVTEGVFLRYNTTTHAFVAWTKATLLGYVHGAWVTTSFVTNGADWAPYDAGQVNPDYRAYLNEIYYACECLCFHDPGVTEKSKARTIKTGTGTDGDEGGDPLGGAFKTVNSATQSGTFGAAVDPSSVTVYYGDGAMNIWVTDNGTGGWDVVAATGCSLVGGSVNYATGAWSVVTNNVFAADLDGYAGATSAGVDGSYATAMAAAWTAFGAASYAGTSAGWEAKGHLHTYKAPGDSHRVTGVVENTKVTDGQVTVPDLDYADTELYLPTQRTYMPISPAPTLAAGSLVGQWEASSNHYHGWLKVVGDFDNEDVQVGPYYFDISSSNFHFDGAPPYDEACLFSAAPTGVYGRCGFGGYCNGEYNPLAT